MSNFLFVLIIHFVLSLDDGYENEGIMELSEVKTQPPVIRKKIENLNLEINGFFQESTLTMSQPVSISD